jgi:hypothetical protein
LGKRKHFINLMFTVTLLGVFALAAITVAMMGASVYQSSAEKMQANFDTRTSLVYISEKVRQSPQSDYEIRDMDGHDALVLKETYKGRTYETWIYVEDGELHELLAEAGKDISEAGGQTIMDLQDLSFEDNGRTLTISVINNSGEAQSLTLGRRS